MTTLLVAGYKELAGKTTICTALSKILEANGVNANYIRISSVEDGERIQNARLDQEFVSAALASTPIPTNLPVIANDARLENLKDAVSKAGQGKSAATLIELPEALDENSLPSILAIAKELDSKILIVAKYYQQIAGKELSELLGAAKEQVAGMIINSVPRKVFGRISEVLGESFQEAGFNVLAIMPEDRRLYGFTIGQLAEALGGQFICHPEMADKLIENVMLGANPADPAYTYFSPRASKAVFCRSDRPDIQLAALDTETRCLVLTGSGNYQQHLVYRAEDLGVAMLRVERDTYSTVMELGKVFPKVRFRHEDKVAWAVGLLSEATDIPRLVQLVSSSSVNSSS